MEHFFGWMKYEEIKTELSYTINVQLKKLLSDFSYLRLDGLSKLLETLKNLNEDQLAVFLSLQDLQEKNCSFLHYNF